jgi:hypothetical protein
MLNVSDTTAKQTFASSNSINLVSNAYAEWNYNAFYTPYTTASSSSAEVLTANGNADLTQASSWTSLNSAAINQATGKVTGVRPTPTCIQFTLTNFGDQLTTSSNITVSSSAQSKYYKMVFYMKSQSLQTYGTPTPISSYSGTPVSLHPGYSGNTTWYYRIVTVGSDGESYGLDYATFTDQVTISNASSSLIKLDISTSNNASAYDIYRSAMINDNNPTYIGTVASTGGVVTFTDNITGTAYNQFPASNFSNQIYVTPQITCYNGTSKVNSSYYSKIFNFSSSESFTPNGTALLDPITWQKVEMYFGVDSANSSNAFNKINLILNAYADYSGSSFYVDNLKIYEITQFDYYNNSYYPTDSVFLPNRPGELLLNSSIPTSYRYINYGGWNQALKPCSFYVQNPQLIVQDATPFKQYLPSIYDRFKYYISQPGDISTGIQAQYEDYMSINKIVLKASTFFSAPPNATVTITTPTGDVVVSSSVTFGSDGTAILYYNGTSWSQTEWTSPPILDSTGHITSGSGTNLFVSMQAIKVSVSGITQNSSNISTSLQNTGSATSLNLIEISPRLEIDISPLIMSKDISKDLASSGNSAFPIGYINSDTLNLVVSNIPVYYNGTPFTIFENDAPDSTFYRLMRQGVKLNCFYQSPMKSFTGKIPAGIFYSDSWTVNDIDNVSINAFDKAKYIMMAMAAPQYSANNANLFEIITDLFNLSGFSDYDYDGLASSIDPNAKINYFWSDETVTLFDVLQSLFVSHQMSMYFDEYGMAKFISLNSILNKYNSSSFIADFAITDKSDSIAGIVYGPNIIPGTFSESVGAKIGKLIINYRTPNTMISNYASDLNAPIGIISTKMSSVKTVWQEDTEWGLQCTMLSKSMNTYQNYFYVDPGIILNPQTTMGNYSGDVVVGSEIMSYQGMEYSFFPSNNSNLNINKVVSMPSDVDNAVVEIKSYLNSIGQQFQQIKYFPTGRVVGVMRGKYNTPIQNHYIFDSQASSSTPISGTIDPTGYFLSCKLSQRASSTSFGSLTTNTVFNYGNLMLTNTGASFESTLITPNELSNNYNYYAVSFNSTYRHADNTALGLFFNISSSTQDTSQAQFLTLSRSLTGTHTVVELSTYSPSGIPQSCINAKGQSSKYSQTISLDVFDGFNHRVSVYLSSPYLYIYIDGREIAKVYYNSNLTSLTPNSSSRYGAFVQNEGSSGTAMATITEIYAANFPSVNQVIQNPDFRYLPRYHFNSESFLNNIVHGVQNNVNHYLWQAKPQIRGFKFYDVKHSLSPVIPSTAALQKVFYGTATANDNKTNIILGRSEAWDVSYSSLSITPFRSRFIAVNNSNQLVYLKAPGDNVGNITIVPLQIQSDYQFLSDQKVVEKVIDKRYESTSIQLTTDWIQGQNDAYRILSDSASLLGGFHRDITIDIFGNPLIQIGDFVKFSYSLKRLGSTTALYYFVHGISQKYNNGLMTTLTLKPMILS